jgi:hypothetical protein
MTYPTIRAKQFGVTIVSFLASGLVLASAGLLKNASFETAGSDGDQAAQNWKMNDPDEHGDAWGSASRENWRANDGTWIGVVRGTWANAGDYGGFWQEAEAMAGTTYRVSAQVWTDPDWTAQSQELKLEFWNADRNEMLAAVTNAIVGSGEMWTEVSVDGIAPEGAAWARAVISVSGAGPSGALQIDQFDLDTAL